MVDPSAAKIFFRDRINSSTPAICFCFSILTSNKFSALLPILRRHPLPTSPTHLTSHNSAHSIGSWAPHTPSLRYLERRDRAFRTSCAFVGAFRKPVYFGDRYQRAYIHRRTTVSALVGTHSLDATSGLKTRNSFEGFANLTT